MTERMVRREVEEAFKTKTRNTDGHAAARKSAERGKLQAQAGIAV